MKEIERLFVVHSPKEVDSGWCQSVTSPFPQAARPLGLVMEVSGPSQKKAAPGQLTRTLFLDQKYSSPVG